MRRSTREKKTVDFFTAEPAVSHRHESKLLSSDGEDNEHSDNDFYETQKYKSKSMDKKVSQTKSSSNTSNKKMKKASTAVIAKCRSKNSIFHAICSNKSLPQVVETWYNSYSKDSVCGMSSLINSLLLAAGSIDDCIPSNMDLEGLDSPELEEVLTEMVSYVKEEQRLSFSSKKKSSKSKRISSDDMGYSYPLGNAERQMNSFRRNFQCFWNMLFVKVLTVQEQQASKKLNLNTIPMRILLSLAEILMALSNLSSLPSVRDAVTEVMLQMSVTLLTSAVVPLRDQIASSKRQAAAASSGKRGGGSAKLSAIQALQNKSQQSYDHYNNLVNTIFNTIFVHRHKDHFSVIRSCCAFYLGQFISGDPHQFMEDTYLKYLGWLANDKFVSVRQQVVTSFLSVLLNEKIAEIVSVPQRMKAFSERFVDRWVEMAVGDVDEEVSFLSIKIMRELQRLGLIDDLEQEKLDDVDKVIFDADSSERVRAEALLFLMDHTEGFEDDPSLDNIMGNKSSDNRRGKSQKLLVIDEHLMLKQKKRTAIQLETLAEFVEYHLSSEESDGMDGTAMYEEVDAALQHQQEMSSVCGHTLATASALTDRESNLIALLAEACLFIPQKSGMLREWDIFISLLLQESDSVVTSALEESHVSTLLKLMVCSAGQLFQWKQSYHQQSQHDDEFGKGNMIIGVGGKRKRSATKHSEEQTNLTSWRQLVSSVVHSIPKLLTRFGDNSAHVTLLLQLLDYCADEVYEIENSPASTAGHHSTRAVQNGVTSVFSSQSIKALFKAVLSQLESSFTSDRVAQVGNVIRIWLRPEWNNGGVVMPTRENSSSVVINMLNYLENGLRSNLSGCMKVISASHETIEEVSLHGIGDNVRKKRHSRKYHVDTEEFVNCIFELSTTLVKFSGLWQCLDSRRFLIETTNFVAETLEKTSSLLIQVIIDDNYNKFLVDFPDLKEQVLTCCLQCVRCLQAMCLWSTRDIFIYARDHFDELGAGQEAPDLLTAHREELLLVRNVLVGILTNWLSIDLDSYDANAHRKANETGGLSVLLRQLQREAFRMIGDLRLQFPPKLRDDYAECVSSLAWEPTSVLVTKMEDMFKREEAFVGEALEALERIVDSEHPHEIVAADLSTVLNPKKEEMAHNIANHLVWTLLNPLGSIRHDVEHINRRQAAAILGYLVYESSPHVQSLVNAWLKKFKERDMAKYLESMLLALKKSFEDHLLLSLREHEAALTELEEYRPHTGESKHSRGRRRQHHADREEETLEENVTMWSEKVQAGWRRVNQLSKRFAQTLGVGKCSGEVAGYVIQLMQVAMKYGLQSIHHLAFFQAGLESFLGHLKANHMRQVCDSLNTLILSLQDARPLNNEVADVWHAISSANKESSYSSDVVNEKKQCVDSFLVFGAKVGWESVSAINNEDASIVNDVDSTAALSAEGIEDLYDSPRQGQYGSGRRRVIGGRKFSGSSSRYLSIGDDEDEEQEEGDDDKEYMMDVVNATVVDESTQLRKKPLASGLHLEGISSTYDSDEMKAEKNDPEGDMSQVKSTQSSQQSDDMFEEFDLRRSRRRFG